MSVNDIPRNLREGENQTIPTNRITVQHIVDSGLGIHLPGIVPNNRDVREPADTSKWPPAMIINMLYTSAVLKAWAPESFRQTARTMANELYYNSDGSDDDQGEEQGVSNPSNSLNLSPEERRNRRNKKKIDSEAEGKGSSLATLMCGVIALRMRSARQGNLRGNRQRTANPNLPSQDRVKMWLRSQDSVS